MAHAEVVEWPPPLVLTIASRSADLLVVGARGKGGFEELRLGSVSDQCIQYAHCPGGGPGDPDLTPLRAVEPRIVVGIDGSLGSTRALRWALEEARIRSASVQAIYAWQYPPIGTFVLGPRQGFKTAAREIIDAATEHAQKWAPEVPIEVVDRFEATVPALLDASRGGRAPGHGIAGSRRLQRRVARLGRPPVRAARQVRRGHRTPAHRRRARRTGQRRWCRCIGASSRRQGTIVLPIRPVSVSGDPWARRGVDLA